MVESQPSKLLVAGSIPVSRSNIYPGDFVPPDPLSPSLAWPLEATLRSGGRGLRRAGLDAGRVVRRAFGAIGPVDAQGDERSRQQDAVEAGEWDMNIGPTCRP